MTHKFSLILLFGLLLISPQLVAGGEPRYPVLDSKFPAAEAKLGWIDNERVMFHGYDVGKMTQPRPGEGHPTAAEGLFIWDTAKGTVTKYWDVDGPVPLCVFRGRIFISQKLKGKDKAWLLVSGLLGKEEQKEVTDRVSVNGHSCQLSDHRPSWMKEDNYRRLPLLEEHGYVDFGELSMDPAKSRPLVLYPPGSKDGLALPLKSDEVEVPPIYVEFEDAYLLRARQYTSDAVPAWLLKPNGTVSKIFEPQGQAWERIGWSGILLTKRGLFLVGGRAGYDTMGTAGGYLLAGKYPQRLIDGLVWNESVSPDGCKVAFVHVPHSQAGADSFRALQAGKPGTRTLKMINLCAGKGE